MAGHLPATRCTTTAGAAATKASKASATIAVAPASASAPTAAEKHAQQEADQPGPTSAGDNKQNDQEDEAEEYQLAERKRLSLRLRRSAALRLQSDSCICGDTAGNLGDSQGHSAVVIRLLEQRLHGAADVSGLLVGNNALKTISDFDTTLSVLDSKDDKDAAIILFRSNAPLVFKLCREVLDRHIFQCFDSDDGDLCMRLVIDLGTELVQAERGLRGDYISEVADIVLGCRQILYTLRMQRRKGGDTYEKNQSSLQKSCHRRHSTLKRLQG